jgi:hypothetical protein
MPIIAMTPGIVPISVRISSPSDEVLNRAGEDDAREQPQGPGQIAHLRRQHRPHQGSGARDGREMVAEQHIFVRRHVIEAVIVPHRWCPPSRVELEHPPGDEEAVEAIGSEVDANRRHDDPERVDRLAPMKRHHPKRGSPDQRHQRPGHPPEGRSACRRRRHIALLALSHW